MTDIRKINKELMSDILDVFPFYGKRLPKTMKCVEVEASEAGIDWYEGHGDISEIPWSFVKFKGKYIPVSFEYSDYYNNVTILDFAITKVYEDFLRTDYNDFADEIEFVRSVINSR